jgi:hypothetical protein
MEFKLAMSPAGGRFFIGILICISRDTSRPVDLDTARILDQVRSSLCRLRVPDMHSPILGERERANDDQRGLALYSPILSL